MNKTIPTAEMLERIDRILVLTSPDDDDYDPGQILFDVAFEARKLRSLLEQYLSSLTNNK